MAGALLMKPRLERSSSLHPLSAQLPVAQQKAYDNYAHSGGSITVFLLCSIIPVVLLLTYFKSTLIVYDFCFCFLVFFFFFFGLSRAIPAAHGGSRARGQIRAVAAGLHQSHSNARSKPCQ